MSCQKGRFTADHLDDEAGVPFGPLWLEETWPEILRVARQKHAHSLFGDEACFALLVGRR